MFSVISEKSLKLFFQLVDLFVMRSFIFFLCILFFNSSALAQTGALADTDNSLTGKNTVSIKKAINYAVNNYNIEVTVDKSLINEDVPSWTSENISLNQWVRQVFRRFDKILYYDNQGMLRSIRILGLKNSLTKGQDKHLTSESEKSDLIDPAQSYSPPPEGVIIPEFSETKTKIPSEMAIPGITGQVSETPEGVVINNTVEESTKPPDGVILPDDPSQDSVDTEGVVITNTLENTKSPDGVKLPGFQSKESAEAEGLELHQ